MKQSLGSEAGGRVCPWGSRCPWGRAPCSPVRTRPPPHSSPPRPPPPPPPGFRLSVGSSLLFLSHSLANNAVVRDVFYSLITREASHHKSSRKDFQASQFPFESDSPSGRDQDSGSSLEHRIKGLSGHASSLSKMPQEGPGHGFLAQVTH